jgi:iron complex outermembrane receptor protein
MAGQNRALRGGSSILAFLTMGLAAPALVNEASAQQAAETKSEAIVVTGSFIRGTPEDAALPVDVVTAQELQKQGSPTTIEMIKALTVSNGVLGESNQFTAGVGRGQGAEGTGSVNLRGFGPQRTLVLLNGKRIAVADTNTLPQSAIGRIEVLKDGAAATYGSDAIGGVVNFITKKRFSGLEVGGDYRFIDGSNGDWSADLTWGWTGDRSDVLISAGYQSRSELKVLDRDWAHQPYLNNPEGGWSGASNPSEFYPVGGANFIPLSPFVKKTDIGCAAVGGVLTNPNAASTNGFTNCRSQYTIWDNLEEKEERYQAYGEINSELGDTTKLHIEGLYSFTNVPHWKTTPSYATTRPITRTVLPAGILIGSPAAANQLGLLNPFGYNSAAEPDTLNFFFVPITNPGFAAYAAANPAQIPAGTNGAFFTIGDYRPFFNGGNPFFANGPSEGIRTREQIRISGDLSGDFGEVGPLGKVGWDTSLTWGQYTSFLSGRDTVTGRLELALRGLGGPNCNGGNNLGGTPGAGGCQWLNPFSNAIAGNPQLGLTNPGFNSAVANSAELADWLMPYQWGKTITRILEVDGVLNGDTNFKLPGGDVQWALGGQFRRNYLISQYSPYASADFFPCADSPITGNNSCVPPTPPTVFLGNAHALDLTQEVWAAFGEVTLPFTDALNVDLAARYEDYGKDGGSTFNPQLRAKWQALDFLAFRGSVGTTFRAPPQTSLIPDPATTLQNVFGTFIPVDVTGNAALKPEKATVYSVGAILDVGNLRVTADYWNYDFKDILTSEPLNSVLTAGFGAGGPCIGDPAFIASHFDFSGGCASNTITKVKTLQINGPETKTAGVDVLADYTFDDVLGGTLNVGGSATYIDKYDVGTLVIGGVPVANSAFSAVGKANFGTIAFPLPQWKGQGYVEFNRGPHNIRWTVRYTDSYTDQRAIFGPGVNAAYQTRTVADCAVAGATAPGCGIVTAGQKIDKQVLNDIAYRVDLPWDVTLTAAVFNIFDEDPPFARTELNYDPLTGDPIGRSYKIGLRKKF